MPIADATRIISHTAISQQQTTVVQHME